MAGRHSGINKVDSPDHTRIRRALMRHLTVAEVSARRPGIEAIIAERISAMEEAGPPVDFVEEFAFPVPSMTLCDFFGVPRGDREVFERLSHAGMDPAVGVDQHLANDREFQAYVEDVVSHKRRHLEDDVLSDLIRGGALTDAELIQLTRQVFIGGHDTVANMFGFGLLTLLHHSGQWDALRADPSTAEVVVEELLRYLTVIDVNPNPRTALEDVRLGGVVIKKGETVVLSLLAGNRDEHEFADPDTFDPGRGARRHLAFSQGVHMCAGQHLARLELQLGFTALAQRFPAMRLCDAFEDIPLLPDKYPMSGPVRLTVIW
jgi:cytochrome P450